MKSVRQRTQALREWRDEGLRKATRRESEDAQRRQAYLGRQALWLVRDMYIELWKRIFDGAGVDDAAEFFSTQIVYLKNYSPKDVITVRRLVKELCGIDVWLRYNREQNFRVVADLNTDFAKICHVYRNDFQQNHAIQKLDFPALIRENRRKAILWQEHLDEIAKQLIDACRVCLEALPYKFYGLDDDLEMEDAKGFSLIYSKFQFGAVQMCYRDLSDDRWCELLARANSMIRGGTISFERRSAGSIWRLYIRRCVPSYGTAEPYFDYGKFCAQYDAPSPELSCVFDYLVRNFVLTSDYEQISVLRPERKLRYIFSPFCDEIDYDLLSRSLKRDPPICGVSVMDGLLQAVRTAFPGIQVSGADSVDMGIESVCVDQQCIRQESYRTLSIQFEMTTNVAEYCELMKRQYMIEQKIERIRTHKRRYLTTKVIEIMLDYVEQLRAAQIYPHEIQRRRFYFTIDARSLRITLNDDLGAYTVDFARVKDKEFLDKIDAAVYKRTGGLITVSVRDGSFMLTP